MKQEFCDCCLSGGKKLKKISIYNKFENGFCDCNAFVCEDCFSKPDLFEEYLERKSEKCNRDSVCGCLEFAGLKKENKLKEKYGFLIYLIPFAFAIPSMFFINGYLAREFYASIIFIVVYAICYYVYNKI